MNIQAQDGVGAVNTRGEVAIFLARQPAAPDGLVVSGRRIRVMSGGRVLSEAVYGERVAERIALQPSAVVAELEADGTEIRSAAVPVAKER